MLKILKNKHAQAVSGEYVMVLFLVMGAITAMTVYFKRSVQGRIHDARNYMVTEVRGRTQGYYAGNLYLQYEPYYVKTSSNIARTSDTVTRLLGGGSSGIFEKNILNESTVVSADSETAPPADFDLTTPKG